MTGSMKNVVTKDPYRFVGAIMVGIVILAGLVWVISAALGPPDPIKAVDVAEYWPRVDGNLSAVTWAHAANSVKATKAALEDGTL